MLKLVFDRDNLQHTAKPNCKMCLGAGWVRKDKADNSSVLVRCLGEIHLAETLVKMGVPNEYKHCSFENYKASKPRKKKAKKIAENYADKFLKEEKLIAEGLVFWGATDKGTHLAVAIMQRLIATEKESLLFIDFFNSLFDITFNRDFIDWFQDDKDNNTPQRYKELTPFYEKMLNDDLLVVDDLNMLHASNTEIELLGHVVSYRYGKCLPLIITTKFKPIELANILDASTFGKLKAMCDWVYVR